MRRAGSSSQGADNVSERLSRLRQSDTAAGAPAPRRRTMPPRRVLGLLGLAVVGVALLSLVASLLRAAAPPPAYAKARLASGERVRLVAVTRGADHEFTYAPAPSRLRPLARRVGIHLGEAPVHAAAPLPAGSIAVWLWVDGESMQPAGALRVTDDQQRVYDNGAHVQPLASGTAPWRNRTLVWVGLTRFDRTARSLTFEVPFGESGRAATFTIKGPADPPAEWDADGAYPLTAGNAGGDLRLAQLRPVDPLRMADLLSLADVPEPHAPLLLADLEARDKNDKQPGEWLIDTVDAVTSHGEPLEVVANSRGLVWLTNGRVPDYEEVELKVRAVKTVVGESDVVFKHLEVPAKAGDFVVWDRDAEPATEADALPPGSDLACTRAIRTSPTVLQVTLEGGAPAGSRAMLTYVTGIDRQAREITLAEDPTLTPMEIREGGGNVRWRWIADVEIPVDADALALAFRVLYRAAVAHVDTTLQARVQPPVAPADEAGLGAVLQPAKEDDSRFLIASILPDSGAATASLQAGDEVVLIDGLPPTMLARALLRHQPGDAVPIHFRRDGKLYQTSVTLDPLGPKSVVVEEGETAEGDAPAEGEPAAPADGEAAPEPLATPAGE